MIGNIVVRKHDTVDENDALGSLGTEIDVIIDENESGCWIKPNEFLLFEYHGRQECLTMWQQQKRTGFCPHSLCGKQP
jgi:hypothetical protein